jgi:hypothetical protein
MSNIKEQIKATFEKFGIDPSAHGIKFEEAAAPAEEVKFSVEGKLQDGTAIYSTSDAWTVGSDIFTKDADGNPVPVMAGEYILEDGVTTVVVDEMGKVAEIGTTQTGQQDMSSEDLVAVIGSLSERVAALESEKTALSAEVAASKSEVESVKAELSSVKKAPAAPSIKSQEFKKNAVVTPSVSNNTFADFMENIRAKQSN